MALTPLEREVLAVLRERGEVTLEELLRITNTDAKVLLRVVGSLWLRGVVELDFTRPPPERRLLS